MAALSGERTFRLLQEDFKAMIDDGTIKASGRHPIQIRFDENKHGIFIITVGSRRGIKITQWLDKKYAYVKDGVVIHEYPA